MLWLLIIYIINKTEKNKVDMIKDVIENKRYIFNKIILIFLKCVNSHFMSFSNK